MNVWKLVWHCAWWDWDCKRKKLQWEGIYTLQDGWWNSAVPKYSFIILIYKIKCTVETSTISGTSSKLLYVHGIKISWFPSHAHAHEVILNVIRRFSFVGFPKSLGSKLCFIPHTSNFVISLLLRGCDISWIYSHCPKSLRAHLSPKWLTLALWFLWLELVQIKISWFPLHAHANEVILNVIERFYAVRLPKSLRSKLCFIPHTSNCVISLLLLGCDISWIFSHCPKSLRAHLSPNWLTLALWWLWLELVQLWLDLQSSSYFCAPGPSGPARSVWKAGLQDGKFPPCRPSLPFQCAWPLPSFPAF